MAWLFDAATDQLIGGGWSGTTFTVSVWWYLSTDPNVSQDPWVIYSGAGGTGSVRGLLGTAADGTTMNVYDSSFSIQAGGTPGLGVWYHTALVANGTSWTVYHGSNPDSLTTVGPNNRNTITSPGSIVLSLDDEWMQNGRLANLKIWTRALTESEVEAEAGSYGVVNATDLRRYHTMLSTSLTPDAGSDTSALTAGATSISLIAGPSSVHNDAALAGTAPGVTGALLGESGRTGELAGVAPATTGALVATGGPIGALDGHSPDSSGGLTGLIAFTGALAGVASGVTGRLAAVLPLGRVQVGAAVLESASTNVRVGAVVEE